MFSATDNPSNAAGKTVGNTPFFIAIAVDDFITATRTTDSVNDERVIHALRGAIFESNSALYDWVIAQKALGAANIAEVESPLYDEVKEVVHLYKKAVYARAKALLIGKYRDVDTTTDSGSERADELKTTADDYMAEYHHAMAAIQGESGNINVLI